MFLIFKILIIIFLISKILIIMFLIVLINLLNIINLVAKTQELLLIMPYLAVLVLTTTILT